MVKISKGLLAGLELNELNDEEMREVWQSPVRTELARASFYKGTVKNALFQGISFRECSFARVTFDDVTFSRCKFDRVDLTRATFKGCFFSDTAFVNCDPYYANFEQSEIDPRSFKKCFAAHTEWNKALLLFSNLRRSLKDMGETRSSRRAEYYFRVWQRRRLYHRWHMKRTTGFGSWFGSLCLGAFTGYGERPAYLAAWALAVIATFSTIYEGWLPYVLEGKSHTFTEYGYYSFKVFFAQGLSAGFQSVPLSVVQVLEFLCGLVVVSSLIASIARKLSP